jgi:hypothetical protein
VSLNRPSWPHSAVEVLARINRALVDRLNAEPRPQALWTVETGQLNLSKPSGLRIVWSLLGGPVERGAQYHGLDMPARCVAVRKCRLQAEIRLNKGAGQQAGAVGITPDDLQAVEEVVRALCIVWDEQRPADYSDSDPEEDWSGFTSEPGQREVVVRVRIQPLLLVLADPYEFKPIESIESTGVVVQS